MPRLVVVPTPIGNLEDITLRALRLLKEVGLVLAEDTRHTRRLFVHYGIETRLLSYHQHNKVERIGMAMEALAVGDVALVSSAGMPSISDPGFELIQAAVRSGIDVDVLPGPSAAVTAVVGAALPAPGFLFRGFLARRTGERRAQLRELASVRDSLVFYEAPHRILESLRDMEAVLGDRRAVVARELTKLHQEWVRGTLHEVGERFAQSQPRGELTVVVEGAREQPARASDALEREIRASRERGDDRKAALAEVVRRYGVSRNDAYRLWLASGEEEDRVDGRPLGPEGRK